ncbi:MAG: hypothetical protein RLZZ292_3594, partial [Bacteroidota bacterium]
AQQIGVVVVPIHSNVTDYQVNYILEECAIQYIFSSEVLHKEGYKNILIQSIPFFIGEEKETIWNKIEVIKASIEATDLATIIYTSGTTGEPKGVLLTHQNILSNMKSVLPLIPMQAQHVTFSFLPLSHIFERVVTYSFMLTGTSLYYATSIQSVYTEILEVRPHYFTSVPRLLEKMYDSALEQADTKSFLLKKTTYWALAFGKNYSKQREFSPIFWLKRLVADTLVYRRWRNALGGRVQGIIVGAAALRVELGKLFTVAGIPIREGYGMTETSPVIAFNRFEPGGWRFGTVGIPVPGVEVKIDQPDEQGHGEILVKGLNVTQGYYKKPDETAELFTPDGWLRTGDVGKFVYKRFLTLTDRKKDIFKTSSGRFIAPQHLENQLKNTFYIEQCMVLGLNRPYPIALIVPSFVALKKWCEGNKVHWTAPQYMVANPKVEKFFIQKIEAVNQQTNRHEAIRNFVLLHEEWTPENACLTPTLKIRRAILLQQYKKEIEEVYEKMPRIGSGNKRTEEY